MTFVIPPKTHPRDVYRAEPHPTQDSGWPRFRVTVYKNDEVLTTYDRNYNFYRTFEPFRQLRDGVWRDYALISTSYTCLSILDLQTCEIIAVEPPPTIDQEWQDRILSHDKTEEAKSATREKYPVGKSMDGAGFCPIAFYVPDWWEDQDGSVTPDSDMWSESDEKLTGEFGIYAGCVWGDDTSWKLQYVDLSRISEGIVTTDARFGYIELPAKSDLMHAVTYDTEMDRLSLAITVSFDRKTGKGHPHYKHAVNWGEEVKAK